MAFHIFLIAALQGHRVHGTGFLQGLHTQELKEVQALLFRLLQQFRTAHLPAEIRIEDHGAHHHCAGEEAFIRPAGQLGHNASAAGGLSGNGHLLRITAEGRDIPLHPAKSRLLVQVAEIGRSVRLFPADLRMGQETQGADPVIDRDHHDPAPRDAFPVKLHFRRITALEAAAEEPDQHGHLLSGLFCLCPDVKVEAVFSHRDFRIHMPLPAVDIISQARDPLHGDRRKAGAVPHARPVLTGLWCPPAVFSRGRRGKGNSLESRNARIRRFNAPYNTVFGSYLSQHRFFLRKNNS